MLVDVTEVADERRDAGVCPCRTVLDHLGRRRVGQRRERAVTIGDRVGRRLDDRGRVFAAFSKWSSANGVFSPFAAAQNT